MTFQCKSCNKIFDDGRANRKYCNKCRDAIYSESVKRYQLGDSEKNCIWIKGSGGWPVRCVLNGEDIRICFIKREIL